jgi:hypothetical protein
MLIATLYGFAGLATYLMLLLLLAIPLNLVMRIIPVGISARDFVNSFFVRLSFTFVPLTATNIKFREMMLPPQFLNHSAAYQNELSIKIMANWMVEKSHVRSVQS